MPFNFRAHITLWTKGLDQNPSTLISPIVAYFQLHCNTEPYNNNNIRLIILSWTKSRSLFQFVLSFLFGYLVFYSIEFFSHVLKSNSDSFCLFQISNLLGKSDGKRHIPNKSKKRGNFQTVVSTFLLSAIISHNLSYVRLFP